MSINPTLTSIEEKFNIAGSIPVVGIFSGIIRSNLAGYQTIAGIGVAIIGYLGCLFSKDESYPQVANRGLEQIKHGALNNLRGFVEFLAGITIIGSIALGALHLKARKTEAGQSAFRPIVPYTNTEEPLPAKLEAI